MFFSGKATHIAFRILRLYEPLWKNYNLIFSAQVRDLKTYDVNAIGRIRNLLVGGPAYLTLLKGNQRCMYSLYPLGSAACNSPLPCDNCFLFLKWQPSTTTESNDCYSVWLKDIYILLKEQ